MTGSQMRNKFKSLYRKSIVIDTCTITDLFDINATYLPLKIFSEVFVSEMIFIKELDEQQVNDLKKLGYKSTNLETDKGYFLVSQLEVKYPGLSEIDKIVISIAYEKGLVCCTNDGNARKACEEMGIEYTGTLGILCCAFESKIINKDTFSNLLFKYENESSAYIKPAIIQSIRKLYGIPDNICVLV